MARRRAGIDREATGVTVRAIPRFKKKFGTSNRAISGDAPKSFVEVSTSSERKESYIAKSYRKVGPVESITEAVFAMLGDMLPVKVARSRLVRLNTGKIHPIENKVFSAQAQRSSGSGTWADVRFMSRYFLAPHEELVHGVELVASWLGVKRDEMETVLIGDKSNERAFYTVDVIKQVFQDVCKHGEFDAMAGAFARMMAFDALGGANDRHPMNWGVIRNIQVEMPLRFSPIFDTARGLFWNYPEAKLVIADVASDREEFIRKYAEGSKPLIGCSQHPRGSKLNHFDVIEYMLYADFDRFAGGIRHVINEFHPDTFRRRLDADFGKIMTMRRRDFIDMLLRYRHSRLQDVLRRTK